MLYAPRRFLYLKISNDLLDNSKLHVVKFRRFKEKVQKRLKKTVYLGFEVKSCKVRLLGGGS
jgi:hypothetical protein